MNCDEMHKFSYELSSKDLKRSNWNTPVRKGFWVVPFFLFLAEML